MIHALLVLALVVGITIAITLFVQHQRDRRDLRRALAPPPYLLPPPTPTVRLPVWRNFARDSLVVFSLGAIPYGGLLLLLSYI